MKTSAYALITAAKNEEAFIERTLQAVASQTVWPAVWVIVSDGSTDRTDEIVNEYSRQFGFIRLLRLETSNSRVFSSQAHACNAGYQSIRNGDFDFVGFLDADISVASTYYETLLAKFHDNPRLGIGGGQIVEAAKGRYEPRCFNSLAEVAGAVQFLRRECLEEIGGLIPLRWGGHDAVANAMARKRGWEVQTFPDQDALHHRPTGTAGATIRQARFREGMQDYFIGYHLLFEIGKCARRVLERPYVTGSALRLCGYLWPAIRRRKPALPSEFVCYLKQQQLRRLFQTVLGI